MIKDLVAITQTELEELKAKAARYDFIEGHAKIASCKMNNQHHWRIANQCFYGLGPDFGTAIDNGIKIEEEQRKELMAKYPEWPKLPNSK